ncbi:NADH dehydrogenase [ubiquinone] 1 alpha subcomplex assembly factor 3 [Smittium culicis]|uniref:NADH dehydrogenase [ubiquinone] 1 alpha subcomplex assembly factor 3 n=1 Tax=Smittium culicis TaxID=133412 RepID=A0A1R1YT02_9FUNG|nr:NADH dehydrogenase [ubiquinone] 1 alpha subcomplex assembly factor 3 [Smittium culicis]
MYRSIYKPTKITASISTRPVQTVCAGRLQTYTKLISRAYSDGKTLANNDIPISRKIPKLSHIKNPPKGIRLEIDNNDGSKYPDTLKPVSVKPKYGGLQNMFLVDTLALSVLKDYDTSFKLSNDKVINGNVVILDNTAFEWLPRINSSDSKLKSAANDTANINTTERTDSASKIPLMVTPTVSNSGSQNLDLFTFGSEGNKNSFSNDMFRILELVSPKPEIMILGTGKKQRLLKPSVRDYIIKLGIKLEVSTTKNACGTYNVLLEEGRKVTLFALSNNI